MENTNNYKSFEKKVIGFEKKRKAIALLLN